MGQCVSRVGGAAAPEGDRSVGHGGVLAEDDLIEPGTRGVGQAKPCCGEVEDPPS